MSGTVADISYRDFSTANLVRECELLMTGKIFRPLFNPSSIALLGASRDPGKWGFAVLNNLINGGFEGKGYPVNPKEDEILGLRSYPSVADVPEIPDLAVIVVPPRSVLEVVKECVNKGVKAGIVITAGFAELGERGAKLEREVLDAARAGGMMLVGPNCNGIMNPFEKLYIQFPPYFVPPGPIAIVAQSGNVVDALARQIMLRGLGCSICISSGNEADLHIEDYLEYLTGDSRTRVILGYTEGFKDGKRFFEVAREVSREKPIVMIKPGTTSAGAKASLSHTASFAGSDAVFGAVCKQSGIVRVNNLEDLLNLGIAFLRQPLPKGRRVGIVTGGGGAGVLTADACAELGLDVVALPEETIKELDSFMPAWWSRNNPVDLVAGSSPDTSFRAVETVLRCRSVDGVIMMSIMPALRLERLRAAADEAERRRWGDNLVKAVVNVLERFSNLADAHQKPVVVASEQMFADAFQEAKIIQALGQRNLACYHMPHQAAAVLSGLASYGDYLRRYFP
jgi:acyl-CoA synthetase (NDP forming)